MKRIIPFLAAVLLVALITTSCTSKDPEKNGKRSGEVLCEAKELVKDDGIPLVMDFMEIDMDEDRDDVVDAAKEAHGVLKDAIKLTKKYIEIEARQWEVYEDEDEYEEYLEDYYEAQEEALDDCNFNKLFEDLGDFGLDKLF